MRLHRFYIKGKGLAEKGPADRFVLDTFDNNEYAPLIHQWRDVFRYMAGGQVILFDDSKTEVHALIEVITNTRVNLVVLEVISKPEVKAVVRTKAIKKSSGGSKVNGEGRASEDVKSKSTKSKDKSVITKGSSKTSEAETWLFISVLKGDNFEMVVQKTTELGVDHIVPFISDRTIKKNLNMSRLEKIAIEATEQSGRRSVPKVHEIINFSEIFDLAFAKGVEIFVCHQDGKNFTEAFKGKINARKSSAFIVGPEGGWSPKEEKAFDENKIKKISISNNVLRAETAGVLVVGLVGNR